MPCSGSIGTFQCNCVVLRAELLHCFLVLFCFVLLIQGKPSKWQARQSYEDIVKENALLEKYYKVSDHKIKVSTLCLPPNHFT